MRQAVDPGPHAPGYAPLSRPWASACQTCPVRTSRAVSQPPSQQLVSMHRRKPRSSTSPLCWGVWPTTADFYKEFVAREHNDPDYVHASCAAAVVVLADAIEDRARKKGVLE